MANVIEMPTTSGPRCAECGIPMTSATAEDREDGLFCDKCLTAAVDGCLSAGNTNEPATAWDQMISALAASRDELATQREAVKKIIPLADEIDQDREPADRRLACLDALLGKVDAALAAAISQDKRHAE